MIQNPKETYLWLIKKKIDRLHHYVNVEFLLNVIYEISQL